MKRWNFTFTDDKDGSWGWNSVLARGRNSAIKKATKWTFFLDYTLDENSVNCSKDTEDKLISLAY